MFKIRNVLPDERNITRFVINEPKPILQVMQTYEITQGVMGDIGFVKVHNPQWQTVETVYVDNEEYDKARGWKMPEPCEGKDIDDA
jgi:hypothetical protein